MIIAFEWVIYDSAIQPPIWPILLRTYDIAELYPYDFEWK